MKPFLTGRARHDQPSLSREIPATGAGLARVHAAHSPAADHAASPAGPTVECVKQGDKVVRLVVTCACGERIEIDCLYPNAG